jgi:hypothetical protein
MSNFEIATLKKRSFAGLKPADFCLKKTQSLFQNQPGFGTGSILDGGSHGLRAGREREILKTVPRSVYGRLNFSGGFYGPIQNH